MLCKKKSGFVVLVLVLVLFLSFFVSAFSFQDFVSTITGNAVAVSDFVSAGGDIMTVPTSGVVLNYSKDGSSGYYEIVLDNPMEISTLGLTAERIGILSAQRSCPVKVQGINSSGNVVVLTSKTFNINSSSVYFQPVSATSSKKIIQKLRIFVSSNVTNAKTNVVGLDGSLHQIDKTICSGNVNLTGVSLVGRLVFSQNVVVDSSLSDLKNSLSSAQVIPFDKAMAIRELNISLQNDAKCTIYTNLVYSDGSDKQRLSGGGSDSNFKRYVPSLTSSYYYRDVSGIKIYTSSSCKGVVNVKSVSLKGLTVDGLPVSVDAQCGSANKVYPFYSSNFGSDSLCLNGKGVLSSAVPVFPASGMNVSWNCSGIGAGKNITCMAKVGLSTDSFDGVCGNASRFYPIKATGFDNGDSFCLVNSSPVSPVFPATEQNVSWICKGYNNGLNVTCTATKFKFISQNSATKVSEYKAIVSTLSSSSGFLLNDTPISKNILPMEITNVSGNAIVSTTSCPINITFFNSTGGKLSLVLKGFNTKAFANKSVVSKSRFVATRYEVSTSAKCVNTVNLTSLLVYGLPYYSMNVYSVSSDKIINSTTPKNANTILFQKPMNVRVLNLTFSGVSPSASCVVRVYAVGVNNKEFPISSSIAAKDFTGLSRTLKISNTNYNNFAGLKFAVSGVGCNKIPLRVEFIDAEGVFQDGVSYEKSAGLIVTDAVCGTANRNYYASDTGFGSDSFCLAGDNPSPLPIFPTNPGTSISWNCSGLDKGVNVTCTAYKNNTLSSGASCPYGSHLNQESLCASNNCTGLVPFGNGVALGVNFTTNSSINMTWNYLSSGVLAACQWNCSVGYELNLSNNMSCQLRERKSCSSFSGVCTNNSLGLLNAYNETYGTCPSGSCFACNKGYTMNNGECTLQCSPSLFWNGVSCVNLSALECSTGCIVNLTGELKCVGNISDLFKLSVNGNKVFCNSSSHKLVLLSGVGISCLGNSQCSSGVCGENNKCLYLPRTGLVRTSGVTTSFEEDLCLLEHVKSSESYNNCVSILEGLK